MTGHQKYKDREWLPHPQAEALLRQILNDNLEACPDAKKYIRRLRENCAIRLRDIVDHITFNDNKLAESLDAAGWVYTDENIWRHYGGNFPIFVHSNELPTIWIKVEQIERFAHVNGGDNNSIEGKAFAPARRLRLFSSSHASFGGYERNGHVGCDIVDVPQEKIDQSRQHLQSFLSRRRQFDSVEQGLLHTEKLVDEAIKDIGPHWSCHLWLQAERDYWMRRCEPGQRQKRRQDALGVGWCNIDHHTYDGSRKHFRHTIRILEKLGYELREMLYAGELAGWGSQVLEQPVIGSTIFADVDLSPEELLIDFAHEELPPLDKHRRAGLVSAMHGESILEAGLNHVAGLYDRKRMHEILRDEDTAVMAPFSDSALLYQELTVGDYGAVEPARIRALLSDGHINPDEAKKIMMEGMIQTHLENIERNMGYKGFNKSGIDSVLRKLDPHRQAASETVVQ